MPQQSALTLLQANQLWVIKGELLNWQTVFKQPVSFDVRWTIDTDGQMQDLQLSNIEPKVAVSDEQLNAIKQTQFMPTKNNVDRKSIVVATQVQLL